MCLVGNSSKGTVIGFASGASARRGRARAKRSRPARGAARLMSEALPDLDGQLFGLAAALDGHLGGLSRPQVAQEAADVVALADGPAAELGDAVAGPEAAGRRGPVLQDGLDRHPLAVVG